jgi:hypothetical protein
MAKAEQLPDGRVWIVRDDTSSMILSPGEVQAVATALRKQPADYGAAMKDHLAEHRRLGASCDETHGLTAWGKSRT